MLGLKRILLIDSFIAGKRLPLMVDGHATVNGRNGSGKSSLLKLLRIFYGEEPRQVENRAGGKDSFVDWYLPRNTDAEISTDRAGHRRRLDALERTNREIEADLLGTKNTLNEVERKLRDIGAMPASTPAQPYEGPPLHLVSEAESTLP